MDTLLTSTSSLLTRLWNWTLQLDGGLQSYSCFWPA